MNLLVRWLKAIYNFLVGDVRILLGTLGAVGLSAFVAYGAPSGAGLLLFALLALTLAFALRHELAP